MDRHGWALWVLDPGPTWRAAALIGDVNWAAIATDGDLAIVAATDYVDVDHETFRPLTLTSTNAARTWAVSPDQSVIDYCEIRLAMRVRTVTMGCDESNGNGLWRTEMPALSIP